jgi:hypothetical protein
VPLCLNPACQKRVPAKSSSCRFCGGTEIGQFDSYSKQEELVEKISMENFERIIKNTDPLIELTVFTNGEKASLKSRIAVRMHYLKRKLFLRRSR